MSYDGGYLAGYDGGWLGSGESGGGTTTTVTVPVGAVGGGGGFGGGGLQTFPLSLPEEVLPRREAEVEANSFRAEPTFFGAVAEGGAGVVVDTVHARTTTAECRAAGEANAVADSMRSVLRTNAVEASAPRDLTDEELAIVLGMLG